MSQEPRKVPWHIQPFSEIDPKNPLASEWEYVIFKPGGGAVRTGERPPDDEIIASPLLAPALRKPKSAKTPSR